MCLRQLPFLLVLACAVSAARAADAPDACRTLLPDTLGAAAAKRYPDYRLPLASDNAPQDLAFNLKQGRSGCLGVASADLDGDGVADFVLALTPLGGSRPLAVVAFARGRQWVFKAVDSGASARGQLYVDVVPPGTYSRAESTGPAPAGEERELTCPWSGAIVGVVRATAIVYCLARGSWRHVVVVD